MIMIYSPKILTTLLAIIYCSSASVAASQNITITVPDGTSNHGDPNLLCTPTSWTDVLVFFLGNYIAHAGTVIVLPGESTVSLTFAVIFALLFPTSGILRGISAIHSFAKFAKTDLQMAARAQALCMVARKEDWTPKAGDSISGAIIRLKNDAAEIYTGTLAVKTCMESHSHCIAAPDIASHLCVFDPPWGSSSVVPISDRTIHGSFKVPDGYQLVYVPKDAEFSTGSVEGTTSVDLSSISCNYNVIKVLVALGQSIYASITLYQSRGDQISRYGYAAFGLTVAPYVIMSVVNLLGNLMVPDYPALYLVESSVMIEARKDGAAYFDGVVGRLKESLDAEFINESTRDYWLTESPEFERLTGENRSRATIKVSARQDVNHPSGDGQTPFKTATQDVIGVSQPSRTLTLSVTSASVPSDDGRPILFIPSCPLLKKPVPKYHIKPRYTISVRQPSYHWIDINLADHSFRAVALIFLRVLITAAPIAIIGGLTRFQIASSTTAERVWTMAWFSFGVMAGVSMHFAQAVFKDAQMGGVWFERSQLIFLSFTLAAPAIGGFVVVGQMLLSFGTCIRIS
jgi:hypothetical protein